MGTWSREKPSVRLESLAYSHTIILSYLICKVAMIPLFHQLYLQMQGMIRANRAFISSRVSRKILSQKSSRLDLCGERSQCGGRRATGGNRPRITKLPASLAPAQGCRVRCGPLGFLSFPVQLWLKRDSVCIRGSE